MGRKSIEKHRTLDPNIRAEWVKILTPFFLINGVHKVTTNQIASQIGISKATLYEHFSSRDEIFELVINALLDNVRNQRAILADESLSYPERYVHLFVMVLEQLMGISTNILEELQTHFPQLWQIIQDFFLEWDEVLQSFFEKGTSSGDFEKIHPAIISRTIIVMLRELLNPDFLIRNNVNVNDAFIDAFRMHSRGVITPDKLNQQDLENLFHETMQKTMKRISQKMFNN